MKVMRKSLSVLISIALMLVCFSFGALAADPVVFQAGEVSGEIGDTVTVPVTVSADSNIAAMNMTLFYNPEMLEYVSSEKKITSGNWELHTDSDNVGSFYAGFISLDPLTQAGTMFEVSFKILDTAAKECGIQLYITTLSDYDLHALAYTTTHGKVSVSNGTDAADQLMDSTYVPSEVASLISPQPVSSTSANVSGGAAVSGDTASSTSIAGANTASAGGATVSPTMLGIIIAAVVVVIVIVVIIIILVSRKKQRTTSSVSMPAPPFVPDQAGENQDGQPLTDEGDEGGQQLTDTETQIPAQPDDTTDQDMTPDHKEDGSSPNE